MTHGFVFVIEVQCVTLIDSLKDLGERRLAGFDQEMNVVAHEHIGIQMIVIAVPVDEEELEKFIVVGGLFKDLLPLVSPRDHMIKCAFIFDARFPWHEGRLSRERAECQF